MSILRILSLAICAFAVSGAQARAQADFPRVEAGVNIPVLNLSSAGEAGLGVGGQCAWNASRHFGLDAEVNSFPRNTLRPETFVKMETLVGLRAGYAMPEGGLFVKIRPGFIKFPKNGELRTRGLTKLEHFALNLGFFGERYYSNHNYVRFDFGDTIINFGGARIVNKSSAGTSRLGITNNPQLSLGFGLHF